MEHLRAVLDEKFATYNIYKKFDAFNRLYDFSYKSIFLSPINLVGNCETTIHIIRCINCSKKRRHALAACGL